MQFINLMRNKLKPKEVANALDANTSAVSEMNALIGSTPLPQGETITHLLANGTGGFVFSDTEHVIGKYGDVDLYEKSYTIDTLARNTYINLDSSIKDTNIDLIGVLGTYKETATNKTRMFGNVYSDGSGQALIQLDDTGLHVGNYRSVDIVNNRINILYIKK